jgi:uncharacterized membrane protein SpoIIM required for sporulation
MNPLTRIIEGVTDESVWKRAAWMYVSFFLLFEPVILLSYYLLPEGVLRGKHPIISALKFSPNLWVSTLQIFGYNLIPTFLIIGASLLAQQSRQSKDRFVPIGYTAFWGLTVMFGVIVGTWSFDIVTAAPPLLNRIVRLFDVVHHSGFLEFSAYLLAAVTAYRITLWYSDRKSIIRTRKWREIRLTGPEKILFGLSLVLLLCAALVESYGIIQLNG